MIKVLTFATSILRHSLLNTELNIRLPQHTIYKRVVKLKYPTKKSREFWRKRCVHLEKIGPKGWMIHFGLIKLPTRL
ncbi:Uncharacterized protein TCM_022793 [Theobroma cacao]|uniref:Uncharacterized protein n=1 Tax=Theobroma cacao TaxID=3641 RepID=A0A061EUR5_THECC|nr:Uncharacterized protein TCM_022793 [Theobroma cacao]